MSRPATLKRGKRRPAARKPVRKGPGLAARAVAAIPVEPATVQRWTGYGVIAMLIAVTGLLAVLFGVPQMVGNAFADTTARAGFRVERIELSGIERMDRLTVYGIATDQHSLAMPRVDLSGIRDELLTYGWIADARVTRRLPDTLAIHIVERRPFAIWQNRQRLVLIDAGGVVLEEVDIDAMPDLPLVIGPNANLKAAELIALMKHAPALKAMLASASWIGNRRWDLRFQTGETLALPEGDAAAVKALTRFAGMDQADRLLGRGFVRFDMRDPRRMVVRVPQGVERIDDPEPEADTLAGEETGGQTVAPPSPPLIRTST